MTKQSGFTLIELIVVIVILGILAATAAPKFIDLKKDAEIAAAQGAAGAVASAAAMNYGKSVMGTGTKGTDWWEITKCDTTINNLLQDPFLVASDDTAAKKGYKISGAAPTGDAAKSGKSFTCTLTPVNGSDGVSADAVVTYADGK